MFFTCHYSFTIYNAVKKERSLHLLTVERTHSSNPYFPKDLAAPHAPPVYPESFVVNSYNGYECHQAGNHRYISINGQHYNSPFDLTRINELKENPKTLALLINYLIKGTSSKVIENSKQFKETFTLCCKEPFNPECPFTPIAQYSGRDLTAICDPRIDRRRLLFFVEQNLIPYEVEISLTQDSPIAYRCLFS